MWYIKDGFFAKKVKGKKFLGLDLDRVIGDFLVKFGFATTEDCCEYFPVAPEIPETLITLTRIEALALVAADELIPGQSYKITGVDTALYGGTDIVLTAVTTSKFSLEGDGIFYNPKYLTATAGYGIWASTLTPTAGDTIIWGGMHWTNVAGAVGTATDKYTLSNAWTVIPYNTTDYNIVVDAITYDFARNVILGRKDNFNNEVSFSPQYRAQILATSGAGHPIKAFQWGNSVGYNSNIGTQNNKVNESYFECVNYRGVSLRANTLEKTSTFIRNIISETSYVAYLHLTNSSTISDNSLLSDSTFARLYLNKSSVSGNSLTTSSYIDNILNSDSSIANNTLTDSSITNNELFTSHLQSLNMSGGYYISNNTLNNSHISSSTLSHAPGAGWFWIQNNNLRFSYFDNLTLATTAIVQCNLYNSYIRNLNLSTVAGSGSYIRDFLMYFAEMDFTASGSLQDKKFRYVQAEHSRFMNENFAAATIIFGDYSKRLLKQSDGALKLVYIDNLGVQVVTAVTT